MKIKDISLSFFILLSLLFSSFAFYVGAEDNNMKSIFLDSDQDGLSDEEERAYGTSPTNPDTDSDGYSDGTEVRSGYDPLKKAPGDKLVGFITEATISNDPTSKVLGDSSEINMTDSVSQKINELTAKATENNESVSLSELESLVNETMTVKSISEDELPEISRADLNIKEQNYSKLSPEKAQAKRKEDFLNYIAAVTYIFSSNSTQPLTSLTDATSVISNITKTITTAINTQDVSGLKDSMISQEKIIEQLKAVEVPEDFVDIHIKALRFALYSKQLPSFIQPKADDPLGSINNLSKIEGFFSFFATFTTEVQSKFTEYGLSYDEDLQKKLKSYGIDAPKDLSELESLQETDTTTTTETTTP
jgi:hypothetical protein